MLSKISVDSIFARMRAMFGNRWSSQYKTDEDVMTAKVIWAQELHGATQRQIEAAFTRITAERLSWPPGVIDMLKLMDPSTLELGIPSATIALSLASQGARQANNGGYEARYNHPVVWAVVQDDRISMFDLDRMTAKESAKIWNPVYQSYVKRLAAGEDFCFPEQLAIENTAALTPEVRLQNQKAGAKVLAELREMREKK